MDRKICPTATTSLHISSGEPLDISPHHFLQKPGCWEDERDVAYHVHHGTPVDQGGLHAIVRTDDVIYDGILDPLKCVRCRVHDKHEQDQPPY